MSEDTHNIEDAPVETQETEQTLDDFEAEFFSNGKAPEEPVDEASDDGDEEGSDTPPADTDGTPVQDDADDDDDDDDGEADPTPEKPKSKAQKRIEELNAKYREEERQRIALEERLAALEAKSLPKPTEAEPNAPDSTGDGAPHWDDVDSEGKKLYPLGQFDPKFNAALVRHTMQEERKALEEQSRQTEQQRQYQEAQQALQTEWESKLEPARQRYADFQEKGQALVDGFADLDQGYAQYLTNTIQSIDNGPDVLYHLASNPELAREIVNRGPALASVELGKLSAQFGDSTPTRAKVTKAPPPPPTSRGSAPPKVKDMDNLDDFEKVFFKK